MVLGAQNASADITTQSGPERFWADTFDGNANAEIAAGVSTRTKGQSPRWQRRNDLHAHVLHPDGRIALEARSHSEASRHRKRD